MPSGAEVSVRELRQNLSVYLRRVRRGETLAVTSRGERIAVLAPLGGGSRLDRLVAEGRVSLPERPWVDPDPSPPTGEEPQRLSDVVLREREDDPR